MNIEVTIRPMTELPEKTGRYPVLHRGNITGHAYYWSPDDLADKERFPDPGNSLRAGWQQLPWWGPTHWIDLSDIDIPNNHDFKRFWSDENGFPCDTPYKGFPTPVPVKKSLFKRIFLW